MGDINATDLTAETLATLDGQENVVLFDTAEGKKVSLQVLADYVVQKATESLLGSNQTVAAALAALNSKTAWVFNTSSTIIAQAESLPNSKTMYFGTVAGYGSQSTIDGPDDTNAYVEVYKWSNDYITIKWFSVNGGLSGNVYTRTKNGGTWDVWIKQPTRAELDPTIKSFSACGKDWYFIKIGKIVLVSATRDISSASAGVNSIGTLEAGWRPYQDIKLRPQNSTANAWLQIDHNTGEISYYASSAVSAPSNCSISGSYYTP